MKNLKDTISVANYLENSIIYDFIIDRCVDIVSEYIENDEIEKINHSQLHKDILNEFRNSENIYGTTNLKEIEKLFYNK